MQKDELIQFHMFLLQLKNHLEGMVDNNDGLEFQSYDKLNVTPYQIYKSKREHKLAIFILSRGIANRLSNNNYPGLEKVSDRLGQISERFMTEKEKMGALGFWTRWEVSIKPPMQNEKNPRKTKYLSIYKIFYLKWNKCYVL